MHCQGPSNCLIFGSGGNFYLRGQVYELRIHLHVVVVVVVVVVVHVHVTI